MAFGKDRLVWNLSSKGGVRACDTSCGQKSEGNVSYPQSATFTAVMFSERKLFQREKPIYDKAIFASNAVLPLTRIGIVDPN